MTKINKISAKVGSNIAFIKYWGKANSALQWPCNSSLSMTLKNSNTTTTISFAELDSLTINEHEAQLDSSNKAFKQVQYIRNHLNKHDKLQIVSTNTFPADCGIASSASGMGALTLAIVALYLQCDSLAKLESLGYGLNKLAQIARMGSGSACRSFYANIAMWHKTESPTKQYISKVNSNLELADIIVITSSVAKEVSSSDAHKYVHSSPFFKPRLAIIKNRLERLKDSLTAANFNEFGEIIEQESLEIHAVSMSASTQVKYLTEDSVKLITWIREQRYSAGLNAYFTIDAGPNIHIICLLKERESIYSRIKNQFPQYSYIVDEAGPEPELFI